MFLHVGVCLGADRRHFSGRREEDWVARLVGHPMKCLSAQRALLVADHSILCLLPDLRGFIFATFWFIYSPHRWQSTGSILRHPHQIIFVTLGFGGGWRRVTARYAPFYDLIQTALSSPHKVTLGQFLS